MYTAKIVNKEYAGAALKISVEFSDGVTTLTESCIPQDEGGFKYWVKSRLDAFNAGKTIDATLAIDDIVDVSVTPTSATKTQAEIDRDNWMLLYQKWMRVKTGLIDTGILTGNETKVVNLKAKVQSDFLPSYVDFI